MTHSEGAITGGVELGAGDEPVITVYVEHEDSTLKVPEKAYEEFLFLSRAEEIIDGLLYTSFLTVDNFADNYKTVKDRVVSFEEKVRNFGDIDVDDAIFKELKNEYEAMSSEQKILQRGYLGSEAMVIGLKVLQKRYEESMKKFADKYRVDKKSE